MSSTMDSMIGTHNSTVMGTDILQRIGIPPIPVMDQLIHFSFVGLAGAGVIVWILGIFLKKKPPKQFSNVSSEEPSTSTKIPQEDTSQKSVEILKERLARGEITPDDFINLRKFLR